MNKQLRTTIVVEAYLSYRRNAGYKLQHYCPVNFMVKDNCLSAMGIFPAGRP